VLVVDDEPAVLAVVSAMLEELGYQTITARSGEKAVDLFRARHSTIDLVLLDWIMPGVGGQQAWQTMQQIDDSVPVLFSSGHSDTATLDRSATRGRIGFIRKPYRLEELSEQVAAALRKE
jgi:DNA-binding NtrC family response regulator